MIYLILVIPILFILWCMLKVSSIADEYDDNRKD